MGSNSLRMLATANTVNTPRSHHQVELSYRKEDDFDAIIDGRRKGRICRRLGEP